jgi:hypothetical protein
MNIRQILEEIATNGSIYDEILTNLLSPNLHLKPELISELAISFLENEKKVNEVIKGNYFLYYFIRAAKNNIASNTSPFQWTQYFVQGKTHRQIAKELNISHCLSFHEIRKIKEELIKNIKSDLID